MYRNAARVTGHGGPTAGSRPGSAAALFRPGRAEHVAVEAEEIVGAKCAEVLGPAVDVRGDDILAAAPDIAASTGSACHTGDTRPSPVLIAMALPREQTRSAVRLSLGRWTTPDNIAHAASQLVAATGRHRST